MSIVYVRWRQVQGLVFQKGTNFPAWFRVAALPAEETGKHQRQGHYHHQQTEDDNTWKLYTIGCDCRKDLEYLSTPDGLRSR